MRQGVGKSSEPLLDGRPWVFMPCGRECAAKLFVATIQNPTDLFEFSVKNPSPKFEDVLTAIRSDDRKDPRS